MLHFKRRRVSNQKGFTIVELMIIAPIVILTIGAFVTVIISMTGDVLVSRTANATLYSIQDSLNRIEQDIKLSSGFLATSGVTSNNGFALQTGQGYDDGTATFKNVSAGNGTMLILNEVATTGNPIVATSGYVYAIDPLNACGSAQVIQNKPQSMNVIYFVKSGTLWRRTVMQSNYANTSTNWCSVPWQLPSCSPGYVASFCKTDDIQLVSGLGTTGFNVQYFNGSGATTENTVASDSSGGVTDAARTAALLPATTASVSLSSTQTTAGRDNTQSATLRATRLDINASSLVVPPVVVMPAAPVVTASTNAPTTAIFSWTAINGATSYTIDYSTDGGGTWTNGFSAQNLTSFTYSGAAHNQTVSVRVSASNSLTSGYGTTSVTIPLWATPVLRNNWSDFGSGFSTAGYTKTSNGLVVMKGLIKGGTVGQPVATLPVGYRPSQNYRFEGVSNSASALIDIYINGDVYFSLGNSAWASLDNIRFMPASTTFTTISPLSNSWVNYSNISVTITPSYAAVGSERTEVRAMIANGATADGTTMFSLPVGKSPNQYLHQIANLSGGDATVGITTTGPVVAKTYASSTWLSIHSIFLNSARTSGLSCTTQWCSLPLQNSWAFYGSIYGIPEYTKTADGMVYLKGLLAGGSTTADSVIAQLPAGYRPAARLLFANQSNNALARTDIENTGNIRFEFGSNAWFSLDSISFMAEQ
jgi:Tfp pilus assembly protein PilE